MVYSLLLKGRRDDLATQAAAVKTLDDVRSLAKNLALALALAPARQTLLARVNLLDGVLKMGKQADPLDGALIQERMDTIKARAACAA